MPSVFDEEESERYKHAGKSRKNPRVVVQLIVGLGNTSQRADRNSVLVVQQCVNFLY